jgi:zinc transport system substrate-binding protein
LILFPAFFKMQERFPDSERSLMSKKWMVLTVIGLALAGRLLCFGADKPSARPRIKIMTTVFPLLEFARAVAGERGEVNLLLPPGAEVHTWQPRVSDMERFAALDLLIFIGADLEPWLADILRSVSRPGLRTLEVTRGLVLLPGNDKSLPRADIHEMDPHIWLDFGLDQVILDQIRKRLSEIEPENAAYFERGAASYNEKLQRLDAKYQDHLSRCRQKTFIFGGHSAFAYLARRYHLEQIPVYGLSPDAAPTPRQLVDVISLAKKHDIKTIFFETSVSDKLARLIAREVGADTSLLYPGHNLTKEQWRSGMTFLDLMEKNLESLRRGLACE